MWELTVRTHFAAAHQLRMVAKKCENLHGHNWKVEVCIAGEKLDKAGVLIDFGILKGHVNDIINSLDHKFLNDFDCFEGNPSSERIAAHIASELQRRLAGGSQARVRKVTAWESDDSGATYYCDPA